jgi:hypothetical protein
MAYAKQTWVDGPDGKTPIDAERLDHIEEGISKATSAGEAATVYLAAYKSENDAAVAAVRSTANAALPKSLASATYATRADLRSLSDASLTKADAASTYATQAALAAVKATADAALPKTATAAGASAVSTWGGSAGTTETTGCRIYCVNGASTNIAGGSYYTQTITFPAAFKSTPFISMTVQAGQEMKAAGCYWAASATQVTVRVDNYGSLPGWAVPSLLLIGVPA